MLSLESQRVFQNFVFINLFCYITISLNDWNPWGTVNFVSLESQCFPRRSGNPRETKFTAPLGTSHKSVN